MIYPLYYFFLFLSEIKYFIVIKTNTDKPPINKDFEVSSLFHLIG